MTEDQSEVNVVVDSATVFAALADVIYNGSDSSEVYAALCVAATLLVPGCDHASLMLRRHGASVTVAATDDIAVRVDDLERATGEGPCLDALDGESAVVEPDLRSPSDWQNLARLVVAETPVRGSMGFRLLIDKTKVGALNLFSDTPGAFDEAATRTGIVLASFGSVAVTAIARGDDAATLRKGLVSNREIGKAIGLMMAMHQVSDEEAFDILRRTSQQMNRKIADLAQAVIDQHG